MNGWITWQIGNRSAQWSWSLPIIIFLDNIRLHGIGHTMRCISPAVTRGNPRFNAIIQDLRSNHVVRRIRVYTGSYNVISVKKISKEQRVDIKISKHRFLELSRLSSRKLVEKVMSLLVMWGHCRSLEVIPGHFRSYMRETIASNKWISKISK